MAVFTYPLFFGIEAAPFLHLCWKMGWNEANDGNSTWRPSTQEIKGILPRYWPGGLPGTVEVAEASGVALELSRVISWSHHGIFVSEERPDKVFALVETIEKVAAIHRRVWSAGGPKRRISTEALTQLSEKRGPIMVAQPEWLDDG